ncbi:EcsC family protein [Vagococcus silagei]|uniref:Bacteriochlorophyll 4-vinyl reductase n=1 Tax=Vagococcus silagei TaxID=2508885 RepID=A0A4S3AZV4_9ENTE|nr:EcsC family protein [Vagococcus silagei]THB60344.1 bacteriochlorophyll 4-vinyl reductase [Vagococcus silagei]
MSKTSHDNLAVNLMNEALKLPWIKVNRTEFLVKLFGNQVLDLNQLIAKGPQVYFSQDELDQLVQERINLLTTQSSFVSFATGIPGGFAIAATIPADIAQFYAYCLKLAQEIAYIYGYEDIWLNENQLDENAKNTLILYIGIMLNVDTAASALRVLSSRLSAKSMKKLNNDTLNQAIYQPVTENVLAILNEKLAKVSVTKGVAKLIPVVGGVISGGTNYVEMKKMAERLKVELGLLPSYNVVDLEKDLQMLNRNGIHVEAKTKSKEKKEHSKKRKHDLEALEKAFHLMNSGVISEHDFKEIKRNILSKMK